MLSQRNSIPALWKYCDVIVVHLITIKMKFKEIILASLLIWVSIASYGQRQSLLVQKPYSVNKQIDAQLNKFPTAGESTLKNSMTINVLWDTKSFFNQTLDCYTESSLTNDTIYIRGYMIGQLGWGFELVLFKDSCMAASFGLSDEKIYKYNPADPDSTNFILLPNITQKVVLTKKPVFENGEVVAGLIELKSIPYYYTTLTGKFTINIKAYFKTGALK
jgi:hypothetical protein